MGGGGEESRCLLSVCPPWELYRDCLRLGRPSGLASRSDLRANNGLEKTIQASSLSASTSALVLFECTPHPGMCSSDPVGRASHSLKATGGYPYDRAGRFDCSSPGALGWSVSVLRGPHPNHELLLGAQ